jgi:hypothetical protein
VGLFFHINSVMADILLISDLLDIRARKQNELEFYNQQLKELQLKMVFIQQEISLTNKIIDMIEKETVIDIALHLKKTL